MMRTALFDRHLAAGARMVPFAGWEMPVQYSGILEEHRHVRARAGLFDLSHMGEVYLRGRGAAATVQRLVTNEVESAPVGRCVYSPMCNETGGVVDDLVVYRLAPEEFMLVVNAANRDKDLAWIRSHTGPATELEDASDATSLIALQGPLAAEIFATVCPSAAALEPFHCAAVELAGKRVLVSRTGYTGEDGFELFGDATVACRLWDELALDERVAPIGLGARDTLRFEARLLLYGNDLDDETTPLEAGLGWTVKLDKGDFIGREALRRQKREGVPRKLVGLKMIGRGIPRHGYPIRQGDATVGHVTSGSFSPTLDQNLGLGYVRTESSAAGTRLEVEVRKHAVAAEVVPTPFYRRERR